MKVKEQKKIQSKNGITLIALIITVIVLLILAGITIQQLGENGLLAKVNNAKEENDKAVATETMNFKITSVEMMKYAEQQRMPTLKELADQLCEDEDFQYVQETSKIASLTKITNENPTSIFTKLKAYPFEFEINSSLQLASIDGIKVATEQTNNQTSNNNSNKDFIKVYLDNVLIEDIPNKNLRISIYRSILY